MDNMLWTILKQVGGLELGILYLMLACSLLLWTLVFLRLHDLYMVRQNSESFLLQFDGARDFQRFRDAALELGDSAHRSVYLAALHVLDNRKPFTSPASKAHFEELLMLTMKHTAKSYFARMQWGLSFLGTLGSTAPFIGLFGTVWGIMTTFQSLGMSKTPSMQVVAPGISSALIATAAGLAVAIPAVIAYNWIMSQISGLEEQANNFAERLDVMCRARVAEEESASGSTLSDSSEEEDSDEDNEPVEAGAGRRAGKVLKG